MVDKMVDKLGRAKKMVDKRDIAPTSGGRIW